MQLLWLLVTKKCKLTNSAKKTYQLCQISVLGISVTFQCLVSQSVEYFIQPQKNFQCSVARFHLSTQLFELLLGLLLRLLLGLLHSSCIYSTNIFSAWLLRLFHSSCISSTNILSARLLSYFQGSAARLHFSARLFGRWIVSFSQPRTFSARLLHFVWVLSCSDCCSDCVIPAAEDLHLLSVLGCLDCFIPAA
jgi:hypothetical protein